MASIVDLRDLVILRMRGCSRLHGAGRTRMLSLLLHDAAQLYEMTLLVASLHWLRVCEDGVFLVSWALVLVLGVKLVKQ